MNNHLFNMSVIPNYQPPLNDWRDQPKPKFKNRQYVNLNENIDYTKSQLYRLMGLTQFSKIIISVKNKKLKIIGDKKTTYDWMSEPKEEEVETVYDVTDGNERYCLPESLLELYLDDEIIKKVIEDSVF